MIENGAGVIVGFNDAEYIQAGGRIFNLNQAFPKYSLLLRVNATLKHANSSKIN